MRNIKLPEISEIPHDVFPKKVLQRQWLVDGKLKTWEGQVQEVYSPVQCKSEKKPFYLGSYPCLSGKESMEALGAASKAFDHGRGEWPLMSVEERTGFMSRFVIEMAAKRDEVVKILMWEIGKSLEDSKKEFDRTLEYIQDTIDTYKNLDRDNSRLKIEKGIIAQIRRAPLGIVLCMGPYNYPLNETFATLIPAMIMGNTVIFKPPKVGVLLFEPLLRLFRNIFPPGVVNTIYGEGQEVVTPLVKSGKLNSLAFIGSSKIADIIKLQHPKPHRMRSILGLEAKNVAIVMDDADLDASIPEIITGTLSYNGQRCTALKMIYVHKSIREEFLNRFSEAVDNLKVGMPWEDGVKITPLPEPGKTDYLTGLVQDARKHGAELVNDEHGAQVMNQIFTPAVLFPVNEKMKVYHEEQFGPVIPVAEFSSIEEPLQYIIDSKYGQQVSLFGTDSDKIVHLIGPLVNQLCRVNINSQCQRGPDTFPFTGRKDSAEGTLSVFDALRSFSIRSIVAAKDTEENKTVIRDIIRNNKSNFLSTDYIL
ncbi:MAG: NADP-dependent glyceraldehyde-3-phosphate dehydrogenase [Candidatus Delongbacteria bacterium]|jgi:glyceraldehyde-3-phosphate dehydrogenase (NADP+)|nr:NADP-dependent glyceraldehyde-3-phosphate dehydrogenase [Candidatus Delongbacteria bacterium]